MAQQAQPPPRLLALDPGSRRVGVALSDELGLFAHLRPAIAAASALDAVAELVEREGVSEVVVGLPLSLGGGESDQTRAARAFAARLRSRLGVPITEWDERLSTVEAGRTFKGRARRQPGELDSAAARVVLQAVLDSRRGAGP